jgi:hypothetical protein
MPVRKRDASLSRRYYWNFAALGVPFAGCLVLGWSDYGPKPQLRALPIAGAFVFAAIGLVRQELLFRRYRCPTCNRRLQQVSHSSGEPIEYVCEHCDTLWETGFNVSTD